MNVLYDNIVFDLQYAGGISKVWYNQIKRLKCKENITFKFIESVRVSNLFRQELRLYPHELIEDCGIRFMNFRRYSAVKNNGSDIYHSSYYRPLNFKGNTRVVVTVHDFIYEKYSSFLIRRLHIFQKRRALRQADAVICVSHHTKQDLIKYYPKIDKNKIYVIYNGVDKDYMPIRDSHSLTFRGVNLVKKKFLLYVGNRGKCKNFSFVLNLMNSDLVRNLGYQLVCVGGGTLSKKENKIFEKYGILNKVHFLGNVDNAILNKLYNSAYCLLFPSIYEGFGIPVLEAFKAGCPVWSTNSSSVKELIGDNYPTSFEPNDWNSALKAFELLHRPEIRKEAIHLGLLRADDFSWQKCSEDIYEVYQQLIDEK